MPQIYKAAKTVKSDEIKELNILSIRESTSCFLYCEKFVPTTESVFLCYIITVGNTYFSVQCQQINKLTEKKNCNHSLCSSCQQDEFFLKNLFSKKKNGLNAMNQY